ncbi:MAG TPA: hypothetical protein VL490_06170 [Mucilaginibacter sp.]|nr:hypothetical protein [Mucilaginibacter sp.]
MEQPAAAQQLKQVKFSLFANICMLIFSLSVFIRSFGSHLAWKIVCSGIGAACFLVILVALFSRLRKLQKIA